MQLNIAFDSSVSAAPAGFTAAVDAVAQYFDNVFASPVTVNINVGFGEVMGVPLGPRDLGESITNNFAVDASQFAGALQAASPGDVGALGPGLAAFANQTLAVATALTKALGLSAASADVDGFIGFASDAPWNFSTTNRAVPGEYDFVGVVEHEITEAMGRDSGLDLESPGNGVAGPFYSPVDLFRYAAPGTIQTGFGGPSYFSQNDGAPAAPAVAAGGNFNNASVNPAGDLADWNADGPANAFNAVAMPGEMEPFSPGGSLSDVDPALMSAIGWAINPAMLGTDSSITPPDPPPPVGTTSDMILRRGDGSYEIYDIGNNAVLGASSLGTVAPDFQVAGLGDFNGTDTSDMLLRSATTGAFQVYDITGNAVAFSAGMGAVGNDWEVAGFGNFNGSGASDMIMRDKQNGTFELYDISNNAVTSAHPLGAVGLQWQVVGFGNFNGDDTSDMVLRDSMTGAFEVYDIENGQIASASSLGQVGMEWQVIGFGDFDGPGASDMIMRDTMTGALELYDISKNRVTSAEAIGAVGMEWQVAGVGKFGGPGADDVMMRDTQNGMFELYDINNNVVSAATAMGAVGLDWQVGGIAAATPTNLSVSALGAARAQAQLAQALAAFPASAGDHAMAASATAPEVVSPFIAAHGLH